MSSSNSKKLLTQSEMINDISNAVNIPPKKVKEVIDSINSIIKSELNKNEVVRFFNIGKFKIVNIKSRTGINPLTKQKLKIPARKKVRFVVAKSYSSNILDTNSSVSKKSKVVSKKSKTKKVVSNKDSLKSKNKKK